VSIYLHCSTEEGTDENAKTTITFEVTILDKDGKDKRTKTMLNCEFGDGEGNGWAEFVKSSDILDESNNYLHENGTLAILISIKKEPTTATMKQFVPKNPCQNMIQEKFLDEETSDVCFEVGAMEVGKDGRKRAKSSVSFHAHRFILTTCAPMLAYLFGSNESGKMTTVPISDVKPEVFRLLLWYVYGGSIPKDELQTNAKDIIDISDKYSIVNLKLEAEVAYVNSTTITVDNVMDNLLYADSKNCALLKEVVMDFLAENDIEAASKMSFADFPGHVVKDLLVATARSKKKKGNNKGVASNLDTVRVSELRQCLDEKGLDVDGSREAMIETLRNSVKESADDDKSHTAAGDS
jgi:speckle-type POZ protein